MSVPHKAVPDQPDDKLTPAERAYLASPERAARLEQPDCYEDEPLEMPYGWDFDPATDFEPTDDDVRGPLE